MSQHIPFSRPFLTGGEIANLQDLLASGTVSAGGRFSVRAEQLLADLTGGMANLLVTSGSSALEIAACLLKLEPGDEVIVPSYTFVTSVSSFVRFGAVPAYADVRADTCNIDEAVIEDLINPRTRAIVAVHYAGVTAEMSPLQAIADRHGLVLIEDAAQAINSKYKGKPAGSLGTLAAFSFHDTKNLTSGEGGALSINDEHLIDRAHIIRDKGTNRHQFFRGDVDKYTWVDLGSSYVLSEILAAVLCAQLESAKRVTQIRKTLYDRYLSTFGALEESGAITLPTVPGHCESNYHMFYFLMNDPDCRPALFSFLRDRDIFATFHYIPLHSSPQGTILGGDRFDLPITDRVSRSIVRLPLYPDLSIDDQNRIIESVYAYFGVR